MQSWIKILTGVSVFALFSLGGVPAYADVDEHGQEVVISGVSEKDVEKMFEDYNNRVRATAGDRDDTIVMGLGGEVEQKTYRYDRKRVQRLYGAQLPQRSFNNIDYPY